jgi:hypothetical protein
MRGAGAVGIVPVAHPGGPYSGGDPSLALRRWLGSRLVRLGSVPPVRNSVSCGIRCRFLAEFGVVS